MSIIRGMQRSDREAIQDRIIFGTPLFVEDDKGNWINPENGLICTVMTLKEFLDEESDNPL